MSRQFTQLTTAENIKLENITFSKPIKGNIGSVSTQRILIGYKNPDGTEGELVIPTERVFSYGVGENFSMDILPPDVDSSVKPPVVGYSLPLILWSQNTPTTKAKEWTDTYDRIIERCIDHLLQEKNEIGQYELERKELTKQKGGLNNLYWKREEIKDEKGRVTGRKVVDGTGPTLYAKMMYSKNTGKFMSSLYNLDGFKLNPMDYVQKRCYVTAAVKIESIFIGKNMSLQVKIYEANIEPIDSTTRRLLPSPSKIVSVVTNSLSLPMKDDDENEDSKSICSEEDKEILLLKQPKQKTIKVTRKKVAEQ